MTRHDWTLEEIRSVFEQPFADLAYQAQTIHRQHFPANQVQVSTLLNFKTGACPEDCGYCSQSGHYKTGLKKERMMPVEKIVTAAKEAQANGATRFCMGAAWRQPSEKDFAECLEIVKEVKALGLETCMTLGMLTAEQADALKAAGLHSYNHNLDTSPEYYDKVITTRTYQERLDTLQHVRDAGINVCCGGIMGMGETPEDRFSFLQQLANLPQHPESVPINMLIATPGTPLEKSEPIDPIEFVRMIATARILMPQSMVRLSAGRAEMSDELQALCFVVGANSIHHGEKLLTQPNYKPCGDRELFKRLGITPAHVKSPAATC
jgi:biotin synthase